MSRSLLTRVEFEEAKVGRGPQKRKKAETTAPRTTQDAKKKTTQPGELLTGEGDPGLTLTGGSGHA
jgi:hypothetical protein